MNSRVSVFAKGVLHMLVRIVSAPRALDLEGVAQVAVCHLVKTVLVSDSEQSVLNIQNGNDADIAKLASKARITVERIAN